VGIRVGQENLRRDLSLRNQQMATASGLLHELTSGEVPSVVFGRSESGQHGNFHPTSYRNICATPAWARRLIKVHTSSRRVRLRAQWRWMELDCANSSDALLMNVFCYHRVFRNRALSAFLGIDCGLEPEFGFMPGIPLHGGKLDRTEIDMKLGDLLVEAKLTETDFQSAPARMIERYRALVSGQGGKIHRVEDWGRRQLAYPIDKLVKAHYVLLNVECGKATLDELEHTFRYNDAVLRHLTVGLKSAQTGPSPMMKIVEKEEARKAAAPAEAPAGVAPSNPAPPLASVVSEPEQDDDRPARLN